jgi:hypothetical protein
MKSNKINAVFILVGIHAFFALVVLITGNVDTSGVKPNSADRKIVFLGVNRHAAKTPILESKPPEQTSVYFADSLAELTKLNVGASPSIKKARAIVLLLDTNEAAEADNELRLLFETLPDSLPLICVALPPIDSRVETPRTNRQILEFNQKLKAQCSAQGNCSNLDLTEYLVDTVGNLKPDFHNGDGITFNERGAELWKLAVNSTVP